MDGIGAGGPGSANDGGYTEITLGRRRRAQAMGFIGQTDMQRASIGIGVYGHRAQAEAARSEEHTSELQSLMRISYAVFCLKKKKTNTKVHNTKSIPKDE